MRIAVVLCEGLHDVAFLSRLLETGHFKGYSRKIGEMPDPLGRYMAEKLKHYNYEDLNLNNIRPPLPSAIMERNKGKDDKDGVLLLVYALGGIDKLHTIGKEIIRDYSDFLPETLSADEIGYRNTYSFGFVLDADDKTIQDREKTVKDILKDFDVFSGIEIGHAKISRRGNAAVGCFIFKGDEQGKRLEDIILPLMRKENEVIFDAARDYFQSHCTKKGKVDEQKSTIGIAGQLEIAGVANTVIIRTSRYLAQEKITGSRKCKEIIDFFNRLV